MKSQVKQKLVKTYHQTKSFLGLSYALARANFKLRNEGSYLGILWYLLYPLLMFLVMSFVRGSFYGSQKITSFAAYLMIGLIVFNFFAGNLAFSASAITRNRGLVKSIKIPRAALVFAGLLQYSFSHIFEIIILAILMVVAGMPLLGLFFYPIVFFLLFFFILGIAYIFAIAGAYVIDLSNVWGIMTTILLFSTPIAFVAEKTSLLYKLNLFNPIYYFIKLARSVVVYQEVPDLSLVLICSGLSFVSIFIGSLVFRRYEGKLAETI